jgi:hypothetical protein
MVQQGYVDALRYLGWKVYCGDPKTKLCCRKWIKEYDIKLIMTHSRYGIRQLPVKFINDNNVSVVINLLPLNSTNSTIDGPYEYAHDDEPDLIKEINSVLTHTSIEPDVWPEYMSGWLSRDVFPIHLPVAGNMVKALPPTCDVVTDVAMVANFFHRQDIMRCLVEPLFKRLDLLGYSYQVFGDNVWQLAGIRYNGPLTGDISKLSHVYATANICPNVHTKRQICTSSCVNERSFMIPLCGGIQVVDNPLVAKYLGSHCNVATSTTDFINKVIRLAKNQPQRFDDIRASVKHVAHHHTYFNRLVDIFESIGLSELGNDTSIKGERAAVRHCWEINARLDAAERGVLYEQKVV